MSEQFGKFDLNRDLLSAVNQIGFDTPTPIQDEVIPQALQGKDIIAQSETGSGKTHAFLLPILNNIDPENKTTQSIIITPSRELAVQIRKNLQELLKLLPEDISLGYYIGGTDKKKQIDSLRKHQPQIVVGTPGRVIDLARENQLNLLDVKTVVFDEADMALDMGFQKEISQIIAKLKNHPQMMAFSATIPQSLEIFLTKNFNKPYRIRMEESNVINDNIDNWLISTRGKKPVEVIEEILRINNPFLAVVFANTKKEVEAIGEYLNGAGLKTAVIHGGIPSRKRAQIMRDVKNLKFQYVVASDLAARGIDIPEISLVINANIPENMEFYIHRVGRTGRNNLKGTAITLYQPRDEEKINLLENMGINFEPMVIKNHEIVAGYDRNRRKKRTATNHELNIKMKGLVKKKSKKVKPGYKKKIKQAIATERRTETRLKNKIEGRSARKDKHKSY